MKKYIVYFIIIFLTINNVSAKRNKKNIFKGETVNLGEAVNSPYYEIIPIISSDGYTLYFTRTPDYPHNIGASDIWISKLKKNGKWYPAYNAGKSLNTKDHDIIYSITPDGYTIFGVFNGKLGIKHKIKYGWSKTVDVKIINNYNHSKYSTFFLSNNGNILLMSAWRDDSRKYKYRKLPKKGKKFGYTDIYVSFKQGDKTWSEPLNLGKQINTREPEFSAFLAPDNKTLYFASYGHKGYGSSDLFMSKRLDKSWKKWSKPKNLGPVINSKYFDAYLSIPAAGDFIYFVSNKNSHGKGDIFKIALPDELRPKPVVLIYGKVYDLDSKKRLKAEIVYQRLSDSKIIGSAMTDPKSGDYIIVLPSGDEYAFRARAKGYFGINENIDLNFLKEYDIIKKDLKMQEIKSGKTIRLSNIFFDYNKYTLKPNSYPEIDRVVNLMQRYFTMKIKISGHTDSKGSYKYNLYLSKMRAKSVANYIISKGISRKRIKYWGYGESRPVNSNKFEYGRIMNRRVEFTIISDK